MTEVAGTTRDLTRELIEIVAKEAMVDVSALSRDSALQDLDIQSADYVMILMAVEERYGVYISVDTDFSEAKTVGDLVDIVARKIEEGTGATA